MAYRLDAGARAGEKASQGIFYRSRERVSGLLATVRPRRIKASHRRRRRSASGQSVQRYYDPQIGLFLSVDPVTAYDSPVVSFNRYMCEMTCLGGGSRRASNEKEQDTHRSTNSEPKIPLARSMGELIVNTKERVVRRTSLVASGGVALGIGADADAIKTTRPWQKDRVGVYGVMGVGGYAGAGARFKLFSWGDESGVTGEKLKVNPAGYAKIRVGAGISLGLSSSFNDQGGGALNLVIGVGIGGQVIVKPPVTLGWEREF